MIGPPKPTLFLDFDGVLHPSLATADQYFCRMPLFVEAVTDLDIDLVISSSWRFHHQWEALLGYFPTSLQTKLVGRTGAALTGRHARYQEIQRYVQQHRLREWRALDDSRFEFPRHCPELILCEGNQGFSAAQVDPLQRWIGRSEGLT